MTPDTASSRRHCTHLTACHGACISQQPVRRHPWRKSHGLQAGQAPRQARTAIPGRLRSSSVASFHTLSVLLRACQLQLSLKLGLCPLRNRKAKLPRPAHAPYLHPCRQLDRQYLPKPASLNSASIRLTDECLGFGFLRRSTSCIRAVVVTL